MRIFLIIAFFLLLGSSYAQDKRSIYFNKGTFDTLRVRTLTDTDTSVAAISPNGKLVKATTVSLSTLGVLQNSDTLTTLQTQTGRLNWWRDVTGTYSATQSFTFTGTWEDVTHYNRSLMMCYKYKCHNSK
jgi:hypothetical protein